MEEVYKFLKEAETYFLATVEGGSAESSSVWNGRDL